MIACDRPLVYRGLTNRLTGASLGCYLIRRRCSRQRKLANPLIRKGQTLKKYLHIRQLSFALFAVFVTVFFPFLHRLYISICRKNPPRATFCHFCSHFALSLLDKTLTPVKGWKTNKQTNKQTGLQARFSPSLSSCQQALEAPPPKQLESRTSEPARRLVYRSSGDSRYLVIH